MSSSTFTVLRCDRCGHEAELRGMDDGAGWALAHAIDRGLVDRPRLIGSPQERADLCPGCAEQVFAWWAKREPVIQPVALPPASPAPRRLTLEDRRIAGGIAREALHAQAAQAIVAAQEEPTSVLGGQLLPGGLIGIDGRAAAIVEAIADLFEGRTVAAPPKRPARLPCAPQPTPPDRGAAA